MKPIKTVVKTAFTVTIFSCVERTVGFFYRIFLSRTLGSEMLGVYQISLSVFGVLLTVSASGLPITVSRMIIKFKTQNDTVSERRTIASGILLCLVFTIPIIAVLELFPEFFGFIFTDGRCMSLLCIILPALTITSVYAVIRGFFWGNKLFMPYSIIELVEETAMAVVGVILVLTSSGSFNGVMRAGIAITVSYVVSFVLSSIVFFCKGGRLANPMPMVKPLLSSSTPITAMRTITSLINSLIAIILPSRLVANGLSKAQAMSGYGEVSGMALPLLFIPSTVIGAIALVIVPELSENYYGKKHLTLKNNIEKAVKSAVVISCLIIPTFISCGKEIGNIVYKNYSAGIYLAYSAIAMLPMSITMITNSLLNSMNKEKSTLVYYLIGTIGTLIAVWFLPKYIGTYSLAVGLGVSYVTTSVLNLYKLRAVTVEKPHNAKFILSALCVLIPATLLGFGIKKLLLNVVGEITAVIVSAIFSVAFTGITYILFGVIDNPLGKKKKTLQSAKS